MCNGGIDYYNGVFIKPNSEEDVPMASDVVSSVSMNRD